MPDKIRPMKSNTAALPLNEQAYRMIKEMIVSVQLEPGNQIDESSLATRLKIGRTPVREALFRLAAENLVTVVKGRGFSVRDISLQDLRDLFETMLMLERSAVLLAAQRIQKEHIEALQQLNMDLSEAWKSRSFLEVTHLNSRFHRVIYQATDNGFLASYLNNLQNQSQRLAYMCFSKDTGGYDMASHAELAIKDHQALIDGFRKQAAADTVNVITQHVKLFHRRVQACTFPDSENLDALLPFQAA